MKSGSEPGGNLLRMETGERVVDVRGTVVDVRARDVANGLVRGGAGIERLPARVRESAKPGSGGEYTARRLRSQREIVRDVMLAASECDTWLTLSELRALTRYGEASISAQLRHLRKMENGAYQISKRHRDGVVVRAGIDGRGECVWEYRIAAREYGRIAA